MWRAAHSTPVCPRGRGLLPIPRVSRRHLSCPLRGTHEPNAGYIAGGDRPRWGSCVSLLGFGAAGDGGAREGRCAHGTNQARDPGMNGWMSTLLLATSAFALVVVAVGLIRILRGPPDADECWRRSSWVQVGSHPCCCWGLAAGRSDTPRSRASATRRLAGSRGRTPWGVARQQFAAHRSRGQRCR